MPVITSIDPMKDVVKQILSKEGPMKASEVLENVRNRPELIPLQYRGSIDHYTRESIWSMLSNEEAFLSPDRKLYLPNQKIDQ